MRLSEAITRWLGPATACPRPRPAAAMFLAAGFTKSCFRGAPLFNDYAPTLASHLRASPIHPALGARFQEHARIESAFSGKHPIRDEVARKSKELAALKITDLIEVYDRTFGRRAVVDAMLSEPAPGPHAYEARASRPGGRLLPARAESAYRPLHEWRRVLTVDRACHLAPLRPGSPAVLVGRLVADGVIQTLLTTNWDAYAELGCELVGVAINGLDRNAAPPVLQIFDCPEAATVRSRLAGQPLLLKLHGSTDRVHELLSERGRLPDETERDLCEQFLVSSSDLSHWRGPSQWVHDAMADGLRAHRMVFLGASGDDPVSFRAVRDRIAEWESRDRVRTERNQHARDDAGRQRSTEPDGPPVIGIGPILDERLHAMFAVAPDRVPSFQLAEAAGDAFLRAAYAWSLLQRIVQPLTGADDRGLVNLLTTRLSDECDRVAGFQKLDGKLATLLCDAIGPGLRWSALAEGETALARLPAGALRRQHYAPWADTAWSAPPDTAHLRTLGYALAALSATGCNVDARTGLVALAADDARAHRLRGSSLLLMPWLRPPGRGLRSARLRMALGAPDGLLGHRPTTWDLTSRACAVPIPALPTPPLDLRVGDARLPVEVVDASEWKVWGTT